MPKIIRNRFYLRADATRTVLMHKHYRKHRPVHGHSMGSIHHRMVIPLITAECIQLYFPLVQFVPNAWLQF